MAKAYKTIDTGDNRPYGLQLSEREMKWLSRIAEIAYEYGGEAADSQEEEDFNIWLIDLQETFRQLDKVKG